MYSIRLNTVLRTVSVLALVTFTGALTACSPTKPAHEAMMKGSPGAMMDHGGMMMHSGMDLGPADANYDLRFLDAMVPHHQGAVVMAQDALKKSTHPEVKQLATNIIKAQEQEIAEMKQWRKQWYPQASATPMAWHGKAGHMMAMTDEQRQGMMMSMNLGASDSKFDLRFLNGMIPHHEGAVVMAQDVLAKSKRPELQKLAKSIITSQQQEVNEMQQWRKSWYP